MININLINILTNIILIFIVPTLCQTIPGVSLVSRMLGAILFVLLIALLIKRVTIVKVLSLVSLATISITSIIQSNDLSLNLKDLIYFSTFILFCTVIFDKVYFEEISNKLKNSQKLIKKILYLSNIIILISSISSNGYYMKWGENVKYFKGFTVMPQVMAGASLYLIILTMYYLKDRKFKGWEFCLFIIPVISVFATGSRTYLLPIVILIAIISYYRFGIKRAILGGIILLPIMLMIFKETSIYGKFIYVLNFEYSDSIISKLTSGRSDVWEACYYHYINEYNILEKIVGTSFDNVYRINYKYTGMNIWAHNDIVNTMISSGAIGMLLYSISFGNIVSFMKKLQISKIIRFLFIFLYFFILMTNGLFTYITTLLSMLIFIQVLMEVQHEEDIN